MSSPTPLRISTITATAGINTPVDLKQLFDGLKVSDDADDGVLFVEYGHVKTERLTRGVHPRLKASDDEPTKKKHGCNTGRRFDNQTTIVLRVGSSTVNLKVFANGSCQMTGLKAIEDGTKAVGIIVDSMRAARLVEDPSLMACVDYRVRMINSDFRIGWSVRRDYLYSLIMNQYKMRCFFEGAIYPGMKIEYYYNEADKNGGICACEDRGFSAKCPHCHKVTIIVFRSGSVIITGASTIAQLDEAYQFIVAVLDKHREELEHVDYQLLAAAAAADAGAGDDDA